MGTSISDQVLQSCQTNETVSSLIAKDVSLSPTDAASKLLGGMASFRNGKFSEAPSSEHELKKARECGHWGDTEPSHQFLQAFHDALCSLNRDPKQGMVSPSLMGSNGSIPLTIIAPVVDIAHHCSSLITQAEKEVILVTCSWSPSVAARLISEALKELSSRARVRGNRVSVKIMYGNPRPSHLLHHYQEIPPKVYQSPSIQLPSSAEIPNLDMEVASIHHPLLGTLHAKFMIMDRKIAIIQSNNIEDNCNLEMMTHLEGAIVDSVYDYALWTWNRTFRFPSPTINTLASQMNFRSFTEDSFKSLLEKTYSAEGSEDVHSDHNGPDREDSKIGDLCENLFTGSPTYNLVNEIVRIRSNWTPRNELTPLALVNECFNTSFMTKLPADGPGFGHATCFLPCVLNASTYPIALVGRPAHGAPDNYNICTPQNAAWLSCIVHAKLSIFIQTPDLNTTHLWEALIKAVKRGVSVTYYICLGYNDAGELMPGQGGLNESFAARLYAEIPESQRLNLNIHWYVAKDQSMPIHHKFKHRACHLKLLIVDGSVAIQGSGNQDTQSWCHSQEINIMVDSKEVCTSWREAIERNQNTQQLGRVSPESGTWKDEHGREIGECTANLPPPLNWAKGAMGMFQKAREKGSFG